MGTAELITRHIDKLGRVVIPADIRHHLGLKADDDVTIELLPDGVTIRPVADKCTECGRPTQ